MLPPGYLISGHYSRFFGSYKRPIVPESLQYENQPAIRKTDQICQIVQRHKMTLHHIYWLLWLASREIGYETIGSPDRQLYRSQRQLYPNAANVSCITEGTIKVHANHIFAKLGVTGRVAAVAPAEQRGLVRLVTGQPPATRDCPQKGRGATA